MLLSEFHYDLPEELIAQCPAQKRDGSRMMLLNRATGDVGHAAFEQLPDLLRGDELLIYNDTRVFPARVWAQKPSGGRVELLILRFLDEFRAEAMTRTSKPLRVGQTLMTSKEATLLRVDEVPRNGRAILQFPAPGARHWVRHEGVMPLPPYIRRDASEDRAEDHERYQTVFAREEGSVAAPTAGLHFTPEVLQRLAEKGIERCPVTLHVGPGTFEPIRVEQVATHKMQGEFFEVPVQTAAAVAKAKAERRPIIAVGTTTTRCLESASQSGTLQPGPGYTEIFIYPGYRFRTIDGLLTNFHLPESTLIMLVSALAGKEAVLSAYRQAVDHRYRFYSYGDCMLIR